MSRNKHENEKNTGFRLVIPFFAVMAVLTVVSFIIPLRPTQSNMEKRNLAQFPEFSLEALADGSYFDDITLWFSDTFPGREDWLTLSSSISSLHGYSEIAIQGELPDSWDIAEDTALLQEVDTEPAAENDTPEQDIPAETEETEPEETQWGGVDAAENEIAQTAVIQIGDSAFNGLGFSQGESDDYAETLSAIAEALARQGVNVISAPAPTAIGIMVEGEYLDQLNCARQDEMLEYLHSNMSDQVIKVDTVSALMAHNNEYIYFRTDHHWTALGAYYSYEAVCQTLGYEPAPLDSFEVWDQGEFEGSIYWKAYRPTKLKKDVVYAYIPQGDIVTMITNESYYTFEGKLLADMTKRAVNTKYLTFLSGDDPLTVVTNNDLPDAPNCVVVKDSFGNCFVPFLTQNYHNIYAIDYRKYYKMDLQEFCEAYDIDDVIIMPYLTATQSTLGNSLIKKLGGV